MVNHHDTTTGRICLELFPSILSKFKFKDLINRPSEKLQSQPVSKDLDHCHLGTSSKGAKTHPKTNMAGKSPFLVGDTSSNGCFFFIVMLSFRGFLQKLPCRPWVMAHHALGTSMCPGNPKWQF